MVDIPKPSARIELLSRAAHPGLMDAATDPDLLIVLILANLMSDRLWHIRDQILSRVDPTGRDLAPTSQITHEMLEYIDRHFTHDFPMGTADRVGLLNLQDERDRLGAEPVDRIKAQLWRHVTRRRSDGLLTPALDIFPVLERDQLPLYIYNTIDGLHAMSRLMGHKKHRPMGVTVCADEATLTTSLATILHGISLVDAFMVGSPGHYTTLLQKDGQRFWCNGKPEYFDQAGWQRLTNGPDAADPLAEFDRRVPYADRFITMYGTLVLDGRPSAIPSEQLDRFNADCRAFFGIELPPFRTLRHQGVSFVPSRATTEQLRRFDTLKGADEVRSLLTELAASDDLSVFGKARYCYRDVSIQAPGAYLANSLRGPKLRQAAQEIDGVEAALDRIRRIAGDVSIYGRRERIAMADEVLLFDTGDDVDRGLLLLSLLLASPGIDAEAKRAMQLIATKEATFLTLGHTVLDVATLKQTDAAVGSTLLRLSVESLTAI